MTYNVVFTDESERDAKKLVKKYHSFKNDISGLIEDLEKNPFLGTRVCENTYKIRLAIGSKNKGKSGGARVITHVAINLEYHTVYILSIYDKSEQASFSVAEIRYLASKLK